MWWFVYHVRRRRRRRKARGHMWYHFIAPVITGHQRMGIAIKRLQ
jgi:hypothetical protein